MNASKQPEWHAVVRAYLKACDTDERRRCDRQLDNVELEFLRGSATDSVVSAYVQRIQQDISSLGLPCDSEAWIVVEETDGAVLVEIDGALPFRRVPFFKTRLSLVYADSEWLLNGVFEVCIRCNLGATESPGQCLFCSGSGKLVHSEADCEACSGTGLCSACAGNWMAGWCVGHGFRVEQPGEDS